MAFVRFRSAGQFFGKPHALSKAGDVVVAHSDRPLLALTHRRLRFPELRRKLSLREPGMLPRRTKLAPQAREKGGHRLDRVAAVGGLAPHES